VSSLAVRPRAPPPLAADGVIRGKSPP
jgi:hypothetical protein